MKNLSLNASFKTALVQDPNIKESTKKVVSSCLIIFCLVIPLLFKVFSYFVYGSSTPILFVFINMVSFVIGLMIVISCWKNSLKTTAFGFIVYTFIFNIFSVFLQILLVFAGVNKLMSDNSFSLLINFLISFLCFIAAISLIFKNQNARKQWKIFTEKKSFFIFLLTIVISFIAIFALNFLANLIYNNQSDNQENLDMLKNSGTLGLLTIFFTSIISAPLIEELAYREGVFTLTFHKNISVFIACTMFIFIHIQFAQKGANEGQSDLKAVVSYMPGAFVLSAIYYFQKNYVMSWGVHFANNVFAFVLPFITK